MCGRIRLFLTVIFSFILSINSAWAEDVKSPGDIPIKAFAQLPAIMDMELSPDGSHIAYMVPHKGRKAIVIRNIESGKLSGIPAPDKADINWFKWVNNKKIAVSIGYTAQRYGTTTLETRLYAFDLPSGNLKNIIKPRKRKGSVSTLTKEDFDVQIQDRVIDWLPDDPDHILVSIDGDWDGASEIRMVDVNDGDFTELTDGMKGIQSYQTDQQHELRLSWGYWKSDFKQLYRSPETGKWMQIEEGQLAKLNLDPIAFDKDPAIAYAKGLNEAGRFAVYKVNIPADKVVEEVYSDEDVDTDHIVFDPLSGRPIGVRNYREKSGYMYFDKYFAALQKVVDKALPNTVNRVISRVKGQKKFLIFSSSDVEPGVYYLLDFSKGSLDFLAETMPGITPEQMSPMQYVRYIARDGQVIHGYLTVPRGREVRNLPLIVMPHGGPEAQTVRSFAYRTQFLASRGYAVFQPNFRGSTGYGPAFQEAGEKQWGGLMQDDVTDGVKWLIDQGMADPDRICIAGASYGGYAAAMGAVKTPDLYQCAVSINGVLNLPMLKAKDKRYTGGRAWIKTMGLEGADDDDVSPYHRAKDIKAPMLIIHAKDDFRVPLRHAEMMVDELKDEGKDVTFVQLEDGDHMLDTEAARYATLKAMEAFFAKHLGAGSPGSMATQ